MDTKERIKRIQKYLNVPADGVVGPSTLTAAERAVGFLPKIKTNKAGAPPKVPQGNHLAISNKSLDKIIFFEVSSESYYIKYLSKPTWPGAASGVTIGIGYDLGYNTKTEIEDDWKGLVSDSDLNRLKSVAGIKRADGKGAARTLKDIKIPFSAARQVFNTQTLPRFAGLTRKAYPGVEKLPADAQGALLSLIFNRGSSMSNSDKRREMRAIQPLVKKGDLNGIADQLISMRRLWPTLKGLLTRRSAEAELVRNSKRSYSPDEIVLV